MMKSVMKGLCGLERTETDLGGACLSMIRDRVVVKRWDKMKRREGEMSGEGKKGFQ